MDNRFIREKNLAIIREKYGEICLYGKVNSLKYYINYIGANINKYVSAILVPKGTVTYDFFENIPIKEIDSISLPYILGEYRDSAIISQCH